MTITYPFTESDSRAAFDEWGANCGPNALAFALQVPLGRVRPLIPGFEDKRYTSPSMMKAAIEAARRRFNSVKPPKFTPGIPVDVELMFNPRMALVRIQWCGPWTVKNANPKWAYRQTHWIATWEERGVPLIFDCNGGIQGLPAWEEDIVPLIVKQIPRANGEWFPTHIWRLETP